jgi:1,4-dihydroxy-2-naphthoate octaprenyltransferase
MTPDRPTPPAGRAAAPAGGRRWWLGARPKTLPMAATPVIVGQSLAVADGFDVRWIVFALTLLCALLIQAGTNLFNDVADFERGNDRADRVGPARVTASGWATASEVRRAAAVAFVLAGLCGLFLVSVGGPAILAVGLLSMLFGWAYSGGSRPVSHGPFGELFVLGFFGVVAVSGTHYLQTGQWSGSAIAAGLALGSIAAAVLLVNNYRDVRTDLAAGRRTLAALLGPHRARLLYAALMLAPLALPPWLYARDGSSLVVWTAILSAPPLLVLVYRMWHAQGAALNPVLGQTALAQSLFGLLLAATLIL